MKSITTMQQRIVNVASAGIILYGYHGYSVAACAEAVGLTMEEFQQYACDKVELAHHIMHALKVDARHAIYNHQWPFSLANGLQLAVLPAKLWEAKNKVLQCKIRSYYDDWRLAFIDNAFLRDDAGHAALDIRGNRGFLMWLGFWFTSNMGFSAIEIELPVM